MKLHFELDRRSIFCIKLIRTRSCFLSFNDAIHCNWNIIEIFTDLNDKSPSLSLHLPWLNLAFEWACCCVLYTTCHSSALASFLIVIMWPAQAPLLSACQMHRSERKISCLHSPVSTSCFALLVDSSLVTGPTHFDLWPGLWPLDRWRKKWLLPKFSH